MEKELKQFDREPDIAEMKSRIEELEAELERKNKELTEAMTDSVTGLRRRERLFASLDLDMRKVFGEENIETLESLEHRDELIEFLESFDHKKLEKENLSVLMADVSFLGFVNKIGGAAAGDNLLKKSVGDASRAAGSPENFSEETEGRNDFVAFRHGGDEISGIVRGNKSEAMKKAEELKSKASLSKIEELEEYGLSPNLDTGVAHISEALRVFIEAIKSDIDIGDIGRNARISKLKDITQAIAERRADINKGINRINLLMNLKEGRKDVYDKSISSLRKGAFDASDEEIDKLIAARKQGGDFQEAVKKLTLERSEEFYKKGEDDRRKVRHAVKRVADEVL